MTRFRGQPVRVLVTGFGPFPGVPYNASGALAEVLAKYNSAPEIEVLSAIIPVRWAEARIAGRDALHETKPDAVLHFGVSKRAIAFEIESCAYNISGPKEDQTGTIRPAMPLIPAGKMVLPATLAAPPLARALRINGYPANVSRDPGRYLCNALFYWSLAGASLDGPPTAFIHIPAIGSAAEVKSLLTMEDAIAGGRILIRASAKAVLRAGSAGNRHGGGSKDNGSKALYRNGRSGRRVIWHGSG